MVENMPANAGDAGSVPGWGRCPGGGNGSPLQYCCWRISWTEQAGGLRSKRSQRVRHDWMTKQQQDDYVLRCLTNWSCKYHFPKLGYILRFCVDSVFGERDPLPASAHLTDKEPKPPPLPCTSAPFFQQESPSWGRSHSLSLSPPLQTRPSWCLDPDASRSHPKADPGQEKGAHFPNSFCPGLAQRFSGNF